MEFLLASPALGGILVCAFYIAGFSRRVLKKRVTIPFLRVILAGMLGAFAGGWASLSIVVFATQVIDNSPSKDMILWTAFVVGSLVSLIPAFMAAKPETIEPDTKDPRLN